MDVFEVRHRLIDDYQRYVESFIRISDLDIDDKVKQDFDDGLLWPEPLVQLNPAFESGGWIEDQIERGALHPECSRIFRAGKKLESEGPASEGVVVGIHGAPQGSGPGGPSGSRMRLHRHQVEAIEAAKTGDNYVLTTGTGSGKSLAYIIPIVDYVLRAGSGHGVRAIVVYPMNALANSQLGELEKFLVAGYPEGRRPVTFARYTGQESDEARMGIIADPPDILLTNYVMLDLMLTRREEKKLVDQAKGLRFLVLDELHTYRGRQGADVAFLVRRVRNRMAGADLQVVGTSATLAGPGTLEEQRAEVARVATQLFGAEVKPERVIGETLVRATEPWSADDRDFEEALRVATDNQTRSIPNTYEEFIRYPLSRWVESALGVKEDPATGRLVRVEPKSISGPEGAAGGLAKLTGIPAEECQDAIADVLMGACVCATHPETGFPPFAFRLHQFISRGDTVYATLEPETERHITLTAQQYVPGDRDRALLPVAFCRECGQEYYVVGASGGDRGPMSFVPRELSDRQGPEGYEAGYLYLNTREPWPDDAREQAERLPDGWVDAYGDDLVVKKDFRKYLPVPVKVSAGAVEEEEGTPAHFIPAPFRFCLRCGISYAARLGDFAKLGQLGSEGRSTATTLLSLSAVQSLKEDTVLRPEARKLLSFTDNRQDASLQAGHFNDFVEIGLLRSALYRACAAAGEDGLRYDELTQEVFRALALPLSEYAADPEVKFQARAETEKALRNVIGYRLYHDLERGWRITLPNLEQCGLLEIDYLSLKELSEAEEEWQGLHPALVSATPAERAAAARTTLDWMRRGLAINVDSLDATYHDRLKQQSSQRLKEPWALDENEKLTVAYVVLPRSRRPSDQRDYVYLSGRTGLAQYLRRPQTFPRYGGALRPDDAQEIIRDLLRSLAIAGLVRQVSEPQNADDVPGYQVPASAFVWRAGAGTTPHHDPIRIPRLPEEGLHPNEFFVDFYRQTARHLVGYQAREHTAQVTSRDREEREERFRKGELPVLFCSPTMELGVDISELNVVNMRNVPPTPANYAQRSGRAGRSGQPAFVYSYCSSGSPHDQYFFRRPELMVAGAVTPPRLDLANEDLVRAHVHALWLAEVGLYLGKSLKDVLEVEGQDPTLELKESVRAHLADQGARRRALARAHEVLAGCEDELFESGWYRAGWLEEVLEQVPLRFEEACGRWRGLFRAALGQFDTQNKIVRDTSRAYADKEQAKRLRREAEQQLSLLTDVANLAQSDFYSYRYFASEGFLPGYSFPRLPLSAYVPGRRGKKGQDEFLQRPRFLAISEFGPRAVIYHEGSRYLINRAILPVHEEGEVAQGRVKICSACGYLHTVGDGGGQDLCESCGAFLPAPMTRLFRLENVSTRRKDRISADEEERLRFGYEIVTALRFAEGGRPRRRAEVAAADGTPLAEFVYGPAADIWRINLGWARRKNKAEHGFLLDVERGYWARNQDAPEDDVDDPASQRQARVIPYVQDRKNCLILEPRAPLDVAAFVSLGAALKRAVQSLYQLEDGELAMELIPSDQEPRRILFYESAEGGAGALRQLLDDGEALARAAREALDLCHFDPATGEDKKRARRAREDCEAACYDCLMSYQNQRYHRLLDRQAIRQVLLDLAGSTLTLSPAAETRAEHLARLKHLSDSDLERSFLDLLEEKNLHLPSHAQVFIESCGTRPDFLYQEELVAVYIDGPHHAYPERKDRDAALTAAMENLGYTVLRFGLTEDWSAKIAQFPSLFGKEAS